MPRQHLVPIAQLGDMLVARAVLSALNARLGCTSRTGAKVNALCVTPADTPQSSAQSMPLHVLSVNQVGTKRAQGKVSASLVLQARSAILPMTPALAFYVMSACTRS